MMHAGKVSYKSETIIENKFHFIRMPQSLTDIGVGRANAFQKIFVSQTESLCVYFAI